MTLPPDADARILAGELDWLHAEAVDLRRGLEEERENGATLLTEVERLRAQLAEEREGVAELVARTQRDAERGERCAVVWFLHCSRALTGVEVPSLPIESIEAGAHRRWMAQKHCTAEATACTEGEPLWAMAW